MPPGADVLDNRTEIGCRWIEPVQPHQSPRSSPPRRRPIERHVTLEAARTELKTLNEQWGERVGSPITCSCRCRRMLPPGSHPDAGHLCRCYRSTTDRRPCQPGDPGAAGDRRIGAADRLRQSSEPFAGAAALRRRNSPCARLLVQPAPAPPAIHDRGRTALRRRRRLALWLAWLVLHTVTQAYPAALPRTTGVGVDLPVMLFTGGVAMLTSLCFGLAQLRQIGVKVSPSRSRRPRARARGGYANTCAAASWSSGSLWPSSSWQAPDCSIRTVYNLSNVDAGFDESRLMTFSITLPDATYPGG